MGALGDVATNVEALPNAGIKLITAVTAATVIGGTDTFTVDLNKFGCTKVHAVLGFDETTAGSVVVQQQPTTAVSAGVLTVTTGGAATCKHSYLIWAY